MKRRAGLWATVVLIASSAWTPAAAQVPSDKWDVTVAPYFMGDGNERFVYDVLAQGLRSLAQSRPEGEPADGPHAPATILDETKLAIIWSRWNPRTTNRAKLANGRF